MLMKTLQSPTAASHIESACTSTECRMPPKSTNDTVQCFVYSPFIHRWQHVLLLGQGCANQEVLNRCRRLNPPFLLTPTFENKEEIFP